VNATGHDATAIHKSAVMDRIAQASSNKSDSYAERTVGKLSMKSSERGNKHCPIKAIRIHINVVLPSACDCVEEGQREADCGANRGLRDVEVEDEFCPAHRQQSI
jgi:hypothetical protein